MRKNTAKVLGDWLARRECRDYKSIWTNGRSIYSYGTVLVDREPDGRVILNHTKYSVTTSQQQNQIAAYIPYALIVDGVPFGYQVELAKYVALALAEGRTV